MKPSVLRIAGHGAVCSGKAGVFHYAPHEHALEERFLLTPTLWQAQACGLPEGSFLVGLTSIYWRESWKYGERAFRYCQHDVGHAIAAVAIAARVLGWCVVLLERPADAAIARPSGKCSRPAWLVECQTLRPPDYSPASQCPGDGRSYRHHPQHVLPNVAQCHAGCQSSGLLRAAMETLCTPRCLCPPGSRSGTRTVSAGAAAVCPGPAS